MQFQEQRDQQETLNLLRSIEKRLATLSPTQAELFEGLSDEGKKGVIEHAVANASFAEVFDFVASNPELTAKQKASDQAAQRAVIARAKAAGVPVDTRLDDTARRMHHAFEVETS